MASQNSTRRELTGVEMAQSVSDMFLEKPAYEWDDHVKAGYPVVTVLTGQTVPKL